MSRGSMTSGLMTGKSMAMAIALPMLLAGCMGSGRVSSTQDVVTTRPTIDSLGGRQAVLYDDGNCPPDSIAQFTRRGGQAQLVRRCVLRPAG